jgi:hypothetical protein
MGYRVPPSFASNLASDRLQLSRFFSGQRDAVRRTTLITVARALWRLSQITVDDDIVDVLPEPDVA